MGKFQILDYLMSFKFQPNISRIYIDIDIGFRLMETKHSTYLHHVNKRVCIKEESGIHSSRIARPRFVARASLTELKACGGKLASMKSGRSLAIDKSCSLFSNKLV